MVQIWGLDLREMQWGKFKSSYMFGNTDYHLRRTKFVVYQCAMIFTVVGESLGTAALTDYNDQQKYVERHNPGASIYNNDFVGIFSYNIFVGIFVSIMFGSAFFFDLFWPRRAESPAVKLAWRICSVLACLSILAAVLGSTVIVATHSAHITGRAAAEARGVLDSSKPNEPLVYKHNPRGVASVVFLWLGFASTVASTIVLWASLRWIDREGPLSRHAQLEEKGRPSPLDDLSSRPATAGPPTASEPLAQSQPDVSAQQHNMYTGTTAHPGT